MVKCGDGKLPTAEFREYVHVKTLNQYIGTIPEDYMIGVMKMDIEGFEYYVFGGGKNFFHMYKIPYVVIEFEPIFMNRLGYS